MKKIFLLLFLTLWGLTSVYAGQTKVVIAQKTFYLTTAKTENEFVHGLMNTVPPKRHGMLFCFPRPRVITLWMKDTPVDLIALFINDKGEVFHHARMKAESTTLHPSFGKVKYAIEILPSDATFSFKNLTISHLAEACKK